MIRCFFEDGQEVRGGGLRHVTTVAVVVDNLEKLTEILLVKRAAELSTCPGLWAFPGGFLDRDERVKTAARREILEETGYEVTGEPQFLLWDDTPERGDDRQNVVFVRLCQAGERVTEPDAESSQVEWFKVDELPPQEQWAFNHYDYLSKVI